MATVSAAVRNAHIYWTLTQEEDVSIAVKSVKFATEPPRNVYSAAKTRTSQHYQINAWKHAKMVTTQQLKVHVQFALNHVQRAS